MECAWKPEQDLESLIEATGNNDIGAFAQLASRYYKRVRDVALDVLQSEKVAETSAKYTLKNMRALLLNGARPSEFEPWLLWLARNDAMALCPKPDRTLEKADRPEAEQTARKEETPLFLHTSADVRRAAQPAAAEPAEQRASETDDMQADPIYRPVERKPNKRQEDAAFRARSGRSEARIDRELPPIEKERKYYAAEAGDGFENAPYENERSRPLSALVTVGLMLALLLLAWVLTGMLRNGYLPGIPDLGFAWFNQHVFQLF